VSDISKATADAVEAARQSDQYAAVLAAIQAAAIIQAQQQPAAPPVPVQRPSQAGKWLAAGVGGSVLLLTVAVSAVAVAVAAVSVAICSLVVWRIYKDMFGTKR
jgi:hypothetical protein